MTKFLTTLAWVMVGFTLGLMFRQQVILPEDTVRYKTGKKIEMPVYSMSQLKKRLPVVSGERVICNDCVEPVCIGIVQRATINHAQHWFGVNGTPCFKGG